jgi:hypothetical protein
MLLKKRKKGLINATRLTVKTEMAKPRMARSAKIAKLKLDTTRIPEQPSATMPGIVDEIVPSPNPSEPEKAQIVVDSADHRHRDLRIENTLTDEYGDDAKLEKGSRVELTVTAEPKATTTLTNEDSRPIRHKKTIFRLAESRKKMHSGFEPLTTEIRPPLNANQESSRHAGDAPAAVEMFHS